MQLKYLLSRKASACCILLRSEDSLTLRAMSEVVVRVVDEFFQIVRQFSGRCSTSQGQTMAYAAHDEYIGQASGQQALQSGVTTHHHRSVVGTVSIVAVKALYIQLRQAQKSTDNTFVEVSYHYCQAFLRRLIGGLVHNDRKVLTAQDYRQVMLLFWGKALQTQGIYLVCNHCAHRLSTANDLRVFHMFFCLFVPFEQSNVVRD